MSLCANVPSFVLARPPRPFATRPRLVPRLPLDYRVSRFAIYSSWQEEKKGNGRHVSPPPLVLFTPETRQPRTRVIIEPRIATRSWSRVEQRFFCLRSQQMGFEGRFPVRHCLLPFYDASIRFNRATGKEERASHWEKPSVRGFFVPG